MIFAKTSARVLIAGMCVAVAGIAHAADPTTPEAVARAEVMRDIGKNMKVLGDMAGGKSAFDAASAEAAKAALVADADKIAVAFEVPGEADPVSEAKPEIWTGWADFLTKSTDFKSAVAAVDVASADGIKAGMGAIGGTCKACHSVYRQ